MMDGNQSAFRNKHRMASQQSNRRIWTFIGCLVAVSVLVNMASFIWYLYERVWWYDKVVHVFTTFAFTLPLPLLLYDRVLKGLDHNRFLLFLVVGSLGVALGTFWEIFEWGASQAWGDPNLSEKRLDVITDLIVDAIGAFLGAFAGIRVLQGSKPD
jgi:hypothetical protein